MDKRRKQYVPVVVRFDTEGKLRPLVIEFDEEHKYPVDKVLDIRRAACQRVGGVGDPVHLPDQWTGDLPVDGEGSVVRGGEGVERGEARAMRAEQKCSGVP